jgi:hypothetical protein
MRTKSITTTCTIVLAPLLLAQGSPPTYCHDHWASPCCTGYRTPVGNEYFSCSTSEVAGVKYCCKFETLNHSCQWPPPDICKYFEFTGYWPGECDTNSYGQWCPDMQEPGEGDPD